MTSTGKQVELEGAIRGRKEKDEADRHEVRKKMHIIYQ